MNILKGPIINRFQGILYPWQNKLFKKKSVFQKFSLANITLSSNDQEERKKIIINDIFIKILLVSIKVDKAVSPISSGFPELAPDPEHLIFILF